MRTRRRIRRIVEVRVSDRAETNTVAVYCKVVLQEQSTEAHRLLALDYRSSDTPGQTPIDRDAATTLDQNTVWQVIRREQATERRILDDILQRAASVTPPAP